MMPNLRRILPRLVAIAALGAAACGGSPQSDELDAAPVDSPVDSPVDAMVGYRSETVATTTYADDSRSWTVTQARIHRPDGGRTYVQWIGSDRPGPRPAVVMTMPYAGIDWSGEEVDARWAGYPLDAAGQHLDVDGDGVSAIVYERSSVAIASDQAHLHLLNDMSALLVFGRYYAGGSVGDDVEDMKAGMWFLAEQANVDRTRVGTFGGSWGGFESLYASAYADARVRPRVTVALYPPSDFSTWQAHASTRTSPVRGFLEPYLHRLYATTGGAEGDYTGLRVDDLCAGLPDDTLVLHDELDNLVPVSQSRTLLAACGGEAVYWPRDTAPDPGRTSHGPLLEEPTFPSVSTYALVYLHLRLAPPDQAQVVSVVARDALAVHLGLVRAAQRAGRDVDWAAPRLHELTDPRLGFLDLGVSPAVVRTGAEVMADAVNATWGTRYTPATIRAALAVGLPT